MSQARVLLIGHPNCGKTTLFNWLTGKKARTVNYPGSTVEYSAGALLPRWDIDMQVVDTPGTYSLSAFSKDESITRSIVCDQSLGFYDAVILVMDSLQWQRQLTFLREVMGLHRPIVLAMTMADELPEFEKQTLQRLSEELGISYQLIDGRIGNGVSELVEKVKVAIQLPIEKRFESLKREEREVWALELSKKLHLFEESNETKESSMDVQASLKWKRSKDWALQPWIGLLIFFGVMTFLFSSIFWLAAPVMELVDGFFGMSQDYLLGLFPQTWIRDLLVQGVWAGIGAVMVFAPQVFILFFGLSLLEDSGYLARAATFLDRPFRRFGLSGRSFVPLLSGYACAVPAVMAARNLPSEKEKQIVYWMIPLLTCSARLPVFALLVGFLISSAFYAGLVMTFLYFFSLVLGLIVAVVLNIKLKTKEKSYLMLEIPTYRWPKLSHVFRLALRRTTYYIRRAGPVIVILSLVLWTLMHWSYDDFFYENTTRADQVQHSIAAKVGQKLNPVFEPMGVDWRVGVALFGSFAAREVFVPTLALTFGIQDENEDGLVPVLHDKMRSTFLPDGSPMFNFASILALLLFFAIALQCMSTLAILARETGSWRVPLLQLVIYNSAAYVIAVMAYQLLR